MSFDALIQALTAERRLADWSARAIATRAAWVRRGGDSQSGERATTALAATVHRDTAAGRGTATLALASGGDVADAVDAAFLRAAAAVGPAWRSPPAAAPARVDTAEPGLDGAGLARAPAALADELAAAARAAGAELVEAVVEVELATVAVRTRRGLDARWATTGYTLTAEVRRDGRTGAVRLAARRREDLAVGVAVAEALAAADRRAGAQAPPPGRVAVAVRAPALLHGGRGLLEALVAQADPAPERQGLVRYRPGQPIAPGAATIAEPLSVTSDGTLPFGLRSAPLDEHGDAVRRFELVSRGVARNLALDAREAARRGASPNGGVRGLVVAAGSRGEAELLAGGPLLVIDAWAWLELTPITGLFRAEIALGRLLERGHSQDVTGGVVRGDALAALALARRSREGVHTPEYRGPATWHLGELVVD